MTTEKNKQPKAPKNKTAYVKSLPANLPAKVVVAQARKLGLAINEKYVYAIRSKARTKGGRSNGKARVASAAPTTSHHVTNGGDAVMSFRRLAMNLGLKRAEELLEEMKRKIELLLHGK